MYWKLQESVNEVNQTYYTYQCYNRDFRPSEFYTSFKQVK